MTENVSNETPVRWPGDQPGLLAADVGGTHARIGLVAFGSRRREPEVLAYRVYRCADYTGLDDIVRRFCEEHAVKPQRLALACAGYLHDGVVVNSNLQWSIEPGALQKALALRDVKVLNDFEALAHGTAYLDADSITTLHPGKLRVDGPMVIVGPGTGLGVAVRLPGARPTVLPTEAGHIQFAARAGREQQLLSALAPAGTHVPYDDVLSGPGLLRVYQALCRIESAEPVFQEPAAITMAACAGSDALAVEALQLFCGCLGSYVGDLAMLYNATGGIYLAGGFLSRITGFMAQSNFVSRFLDKGVLRTFLQTVPVHVVDHGQLAVMGAASWMTDRHTHDTAAH